MIDGKTVMMKLIALGFAHLAVSAPTLASSIDTIENPGYEFTKTHCSECHRITEGELGRGPFNAPSFQAIANDPAITRTSLTVFLRTPHSRMPDFILTDEESEEVIDYILSLK